MIELNYCDVNIMTNNRMILKTYAEPFVGKYIWRDFNDSILKGSTKYDYIIYRIPHMFGYKAVRARETYRCSDFYVYDLQTFKLYP